MQVIKIIFPNQLFQTNPLFAIAGPVYLIEENLFFRQFNFHKRKIAFHRATMKCYRDYLVSQGFSVRYIQSFEQEADIRILIEQLPGLGFESIAMVDPVDDWLTRRIMKNCSRLNVELTILESPMFLNDSNGLKRYFQPAKNKFFLADFYKQERIGQKILVDVTGEPAGGQWSFDEENRKKYPKGKPVVKINFPETDSYVEEAYAYTTQYYPNNIGFLNRSVNYPISFAAALDWLDQFLKNRMAEFGDYEDAIVFQEMVLNHSLLTPMLNVGLITPAQIVERTLAYCQTENIPINSLEGFIRQLIGWREFMRGVYVSIGRIERTKNYWGFTRKIPAGFYDGTTGIMPIDETIKKVLQTGYCHHIERLMVLGNFMLLCEFDPSEVYRWFMELFIDAYDWVMVPNVYGMSQFADGGMMSTKPYVSGSNYLMKMSNYPKGDWQQTWDALFWRFLSKHRIFFLKNPRLSMLVNTFDKWDADKRHAIQQTAEVYLSKLSL